MKELTAPMNFSILFLHKNMMKFNILFLHKNSIPPIPGAEGFFVLTKCGNVPRICCGNLLSCSILEAIASLGIRWLNVPVIASEPFSKLKI